ncbi:endo-1,4-beta-xylanase [Clostridium tertium]|uniref:endo-1,4-beta-xylanase n=1 Tax=Clostridium tertium TaxID=1559 RepID=UPI0024B3AE4D|nr:endo-1,4-beta-xylanase [Clostridium tertium]MDI9217054.1 endo-1,4-beta-xylanase [Clostridium tertium]
MRKRKKFKVVNILTVIFMTLGIFSSVSIDAFAKDTENLIENGSFEDGQKGNIVSNSTFENGVEGWDKQGTVTLESVNDIFYEGSHSLKVSGRGAEWAGPSYNLTEKMVSGRTYDVSLWVMYNEGSNPEETIKATFKPGYVTVGEVKAKKGEWTEIKGIIKATEDSEEATSMYIEAPNLDLPFYYVDNVKIEGELPAKPIEIEQDIPSLYESFKDYFLVGGAVNPGDFGNNSLTEQLVDKHYNIMTAENAMKPDALQKEEGVFTFEQADKLVDYAKANNIIMRGHTLVWHNQVPDWFFQDKDNPGKLASKEILLERERTHIRTVLNHYKEKYGTASEGSPIKYWDVVNEVISDSGEYRDSKWYQIAGLDYIKVAFETAREVDPSLKLFINDYNIERNNAKTNKLYELVKELKAEGVPIDGVGLQMHVSSDVPMDSIKKSMEKYESIPGIELQVTELDVSMGLENEAVTHEVLLKQGRYYKQLFDLFKSKKESISAVVIWGVIDDTSWVKTYKPLLFNGKYKAKPAFYSIVDPQNAEINREQTQAVEGKPLNKDDIIWSTVRTLDINTFYEGLDGATAKAQIMWDEKNLYLKAYVNDNTKNNDDNFEVFLDLNNDKTEAYGDDDKHITIKRNEAINDENGYLIYKVIPLDTALTTEKVIGFDVRISDYNADGSKNSIVVLNDYSNSQDTNTKYFADLKLGNKSKIEYSIFGTAIIDGKLDEAWKNAKEISTDVWVTGNSGATAKVKTMWDNNNLYVIADVTDTVLNKSNENAWEQDSIEIFLDQNNGKTSSYQGDDSQIRVNFENMVTVSGYKPEGLTTQTSITDKGYIVELAIPLTEITPTEGNILGFDVQVNDANEAGERTGVATWCDPSGASYANTSRFGNIRLIKNEVKPEEPSKPEQPGNPENPENPENSGNPSNPQVPEQPGNNNPGPKPGDNNQGGNPGDNNSGENPSNPGENNNGQKPGSDNQEQQPGNTNSGANENLPKTGGSNPIYLLVIATVIIGVGGLLFYKGKKEKLSKTK